NLMHKPEIELEQIPDKLTVTLNNDLPCSSRVLTDQVNCAFSAFAAHRLHAHSFPNYYWGINKAQHGILLHQVLAYFWNKVETQANLLRYSTEEIEQLIQLAIDHAISTLSNEKSHYLSADYTDLEKEALTN